jgi:hypothetical protein
MIKYLLFVPSFMFALLVWAATSSVAYIAAFTHVTVASFIAVFNLPTNVWTTIKEMNDATL